MQFLNWLFGGSRQSRDEGPGIEQHLEYLETLALPAIALLPAAEPKLSRIGGLPTLSDDVAWPQWKGKPLGFLCQIDLAEIPGECERNGLPSAGMLYFFYDQDQESWGLGPDDNGSWSVIYSAAPPANAATRPAPKGLDKKRIFAEKPVVFAPVKTYPNWQDERIEALDLNDKQSDQYCDLCDRVFHGPAHHLFGYAAPIQDNDMDLELDTEAGRRDWTLLLQLDTDDDANMMFGDAGMLYFWIRKQDLGELRFDKCRMVMQCT